jgi:hypothetical protein
VAEWRIFKFITRNSATGAGRFRAKHDHTVPIGTTRTSSRQYTSLSRTPADAAFPLPPCSNTIPKADAPLGQRPRPKADCTMLVRLALSRRHSPTASIIAFKKEAAIDRSSRPSICEHSRFAAFNDVLVPRSVTCRPIGRPTIGRSGQVRSSCVGVRSAWAFVFHYHSSPALAVKRDRLVLPTGGLSALLGYLLRVFCLASLLLVPPWISSCVLAWIPPPGPHSEMSK